MSQRLKLTPVHAKTVNVMNNAISLDKVRANMVVVFLKTNQVDKSHRGPVADIIIPEPFVRRHPLPVFEHLFSAFSMWNTLRSLFCYEKQ